MEEFGFREMLSAFQVLITWLLVFFLISNKNKKYVSNILLALFLLFSAQDSSGLISYYLLYPKFPALGLLLNSTVFLVYPLFFLYVLSVIDENFKLKKIHLIHIVFFVINFLVFVPSVYAADFQSQVDFLDYDTSQVPSEIKISYFLIHIQIPIYLLLSYFEIRKYKTLLFENYSNVNSNYFKWLIQLILLFSIEFLVGTLKNVFRFKGDADVYVYFSFFVGIASLGIICWMVLKAMKNPELFSGIDMRLKSVKTIVEDEGPKQEYSKDVGKLRKFMDSNEPYLDPSLSAYDLAKQLSMSTKELSVLINHNLNQHFFDFVNGYRIRKAMEILQDANKNEITVLEILYEVGFNSKSSFNTAFKKYTKLTPTQYRESASKKLAS